MGLQLNFIEDLIDHLSGLAAACMGKDPEKVVVKSEQVWIDGRTMKRNRLRQRRRYAKMAMR